MDYQFPHLKNPESYTCKIFDYNKGHGQLRIHLRHLENPEKQFYYIFGSVEYFSGQLYKRWNGAHFSIGSDSEMLEIARRLEDFNNRSDDELIGSPFRRKLYKIKLPQDTTLILAGTGVGITKTLR